MYLVSIYFDEMTNQKINSYMAAAAKISGNNKMIEGKVPPHITISSFETKKEEKVISVLEEVAINMGRGTLQAACVGAFPSNVLFVAPVVNEYLHSLSVLVYDSIAGIEGIKISRYYQPFQWIPHFTIAKNLSKEEMTKAFQEVQKEFSMFNGEVIRIGLAKTNPYRNIVSWELKGSGEMR